MTHKLIIDTDPGIDDAIAIYLALRSPEIELLGLTTIFGNNATPLMTTNALRLLEIAGRKDIPVAHGAEHPLVGEYHVPQLLVHGDDGQGNVHLPPPTTRPIDQSAAQFIIEQVMKNSGEVTLLPIGPLTNLALALRLEPRLVEHVKEVVIMGGNAFCAGNISPAAEANIYKDPEAAEVVFSTGWQVTMVGLDVTSQVVMDDDDFARLGTGINPLAKHLTRIIPYYMNFYKMYRSHLMLHDPTALAYLLRPDLFTVMSCAVRVELNGLGRGKTWAVPSDRHRDTPEFAAWQGRPVINICTQVDSKTSVEFILGRLIG